MNMKVMLPTMSTHHHVSHQKMTQIWRMVFDLTYPEVSMFSGAGFNTLIHEALGDTNIEDLWLPYFTLTTDITDSTARIHTHGNSLPSPGA